ncbi:hypothetical protein D3C85_1654630 [compost metagenome]
MLDVVAGEQRIHRSVLDLGHVGHGADDVRVDTLIDIEAQFLPLLRGEALGRAVLALWTATYMEEGFHNQLLDQGPCRMAKGEMGACSAGQCLQRTPAHTRGSAG